MPRAKGLTKRAIKKKVIQFVDALSSGEDKAEEALATARAAPPAEATPPAEVDEADAVALFDSPGRKQAEDAEKIFEGTFNRMKILDRVLRQSKKEETLARRLHEAKMKRWCDPIRERKRKKPFLAASRIYEALIEMGNAQLKRACVEREAVRAEADCFAARIRVLEVENEQLRSRLSVGPILR